MRVVSHFRPVSRIIRRVAMAGLVVSLLATWVAIWPLRSAGLVVFAFLYFIWLLGYIAWAFRQGARAAGGVTHWRMQHAALGALLLAVRVRSCGAPRGMALLTRSRGVAGSAGRARGRAELLLCLRAAGVASAHVAVIRALRVAVGSRCSRAASPSRNDVLNRLCTFAVSAVGATGGCCGLLG